MNKNVSYCYTRNSFKLTLVFTVMLFVLTGCCCCGAGENITANPRQDPKLARDQKAPPGNEEISAYKTGMLFSFGEERKNDSQKVITSVPEGGFKDLSVYYNLPESSGCPFGLESVKSFITGGPNINFKSAGDDVYPNGSHKPGIGFQIGFGTEYRFNDKWSVVPSLLYKQNNASEEATLYDGPGDPPGGGDPGVGIDIVDKYSYNYLSAPILAQYNLTDDLTLSAGPEVNYLLKSKVKSSMSYGGTTNKSETDLTNNSVKLGLGVQVGLKYQIPDSRWGVQVVYDHRLSRLNKKNPEGYGNYEVPAWRMKSVQLGVTCKFCDLLKGKK